MENEEQIRQIERFLNEVVIGELGRIQGLELSYMQFVLMGQTIEVLGSFLDAKPVKARGQSSRRFARSVDRLFGGRYRLLNDGFFLYDKLRNQMTHAFLPGGDLLLFGTRELAGEYRHLEFAGKRLVLVGEVFYEDICAACRRLLRGLKEGKIKPKSIAQLPPAGEEMRENECQSRNIF